MATNDDAIYYSSLGAALSLSLSITGAAAGTVAAVTRPSLQPVDPTGSAVEASEDPRAYLIAADGESRPKSLRQYVDGNGEVRNVVLGTFFSGVLGIYGIIIAVIIAGKDTDEVSLSDGYRFFAAGLTNGIACLVAGVGLALASWKGNVSSAKRFAVYCCFIEALGLYGLITALVMCSPKNT